MSTNHNPSGHTPLHTVDSDHAHDVMGDHSHHHHHKHPTKPKPSVTLNVTSMVDILFNLLVYFIVTANFAMDEGALKAKLPPPPGASSTKAEDDLDGGTKRNLEVRSTRDGYTCRLIFAGRDVADFAALRQTLVANNQKNGGKINPDLDPIMIMPDGKVRWQHVVNAFNQTVGAGYKKVGFGEGK